VVVVEEYETMSPNRVARSKKIKRPNLAIISFKKGQILKNEKRPNFLKKLLK